MTTRSSRPFRPTALAAATMSLVLAPAICAQDAGPEPYLRVAESDGGARIALEVAARTFEPADGQGPTIRLVGAVHIAEPEFYSSVQALLDSLDLVLFEGVMPAGLGDADALLLHDDADDAARIEVTRKRIGALAAAVNAFHIRKDRLPESLDEVRAVLPRHVLSVIEPAFADAWSNPIAFTPAPKEEAPAHPAFDFVSLGADGAPGGEGPAADIRYSDTAPEPHDGFGASDANPNIQQQLAESLRLVFQLDAMDHTGDTWRNADLSIDQVQARLDDVGADGSRLFTLLDGSSGMTKLIGFFLKLVSLDPASSAMLRVAIIEMLSRADELIAGMPGDMAKLMDVLIKDRNNVVLDDLAAAIADDPDLTSIGVIYGAGHMNDLERRIVADLGYRPVDTQWRQAISVTADDIGMTPTQLTAMRRMVSRMMERQMKALGR